MKRVCCCLLGICLLASCGSKQPQVDRSNEEGVEVVLNHLEPDLLPGVPPALELEEVLAIDTERDEVVRTGLTAIETFCLDRDGNIYIMMRQSPGMFIYKFDSAGKFLMSFGRKGQGPGEFEWGGDIIVDEEDRVIAKDMTKRKFFAFSRDGILLEEVALGKNMSIVKYLGRKKFLTQWQELDPNKPVFRNHYCIANEDLSSALEFYNFEFDDTRRSPRYIPSGTAIISGASDQYIFIGDSRDGYEIRVFDFSGKLVRRIRKTFRPVPVSDAYKGVIRRMQERRESYGQEMLRKLSFPAHLPPFRDLFSDERGLIYVMTNEREGKRTYWYDIFTEEGVFVGRFKLDNVQVFYFEGEESRAEPTHVVVRGDRLYCLREKDNGYMTLTIYKMKWNSSPRRR